MAIENWRTARMVTPNRGTSGRYQTSFVLCAEALANHGADNVAEWLEAVGYCVIGPYTGNTALIARIDRTEWQKHMLEDARFSSGGVPDDLWAAARFYRENVSGDVIRDVPEKVARLLPDNEYSPLTEIHYKNRLITYLELTAETTTMPIIHSTELDLDNLPAMEPIPMKTVIVVFDTEGTEHTYFAPESAKAGDYCVVYAGSAKLTPSNRAMPFSVGQILRDTPDLEGKARAAILGTFNEEFAQVVQKNMDIRAAVKAKLQQKKRQFEERAIFEMLAEKDPEAKRLLDMLKQMEG